MAVATETPAAGSSRAGTNVDYDCDARMTSSLMIYDSIVWCVLGQLNFVHQIGQTVGCRAKMAAPRLMSHLQPTGRRVQVIMLQV